MPKLICVLQQSVQQSEKFHCSHYCKIPDDILPSVWFLGSKASATMGHLAAARLFTLEQSDLSCGIVQVHSKCLCIVHRLFHIKRKLTEKEQVRLSAHAYCGNPFKVWINPVFSVKLFWAMRFVSSFRLCRDIVVNMWMGLLSQQSWLIFWIPRK